MRIPTAFADDDLVRGIDVSHWQGVIDWKQVAAFGIAFAFAKATEGETFVDKRFEVNAEGIQANGIVLGAYHFYRPKRDARIQAEHFLDTVVRFNLIPVLDIEISQNLPADWIVGGVKEWMALVGAGLNRMALLYTYANFANSHLKGCGDFVEYPLWIAHYTEKPAPALPQAFSDYKIWQFTDKGRVPGISGDVDLNRLKGSIDELQAP